MLWRLIHGGSATVEVSLGEAGASPGVPGLCLLTTLGDGDVPALGPQFLYL